MITVELVMKLFVSGGSSNLTKRSECQCECSINQKSRLPWVPSKTRKRIERMEEKILCIKGNEVRTDLNHYIAVLQTCQNVV